MNMVAVIDDMKSVSHHLMYITKGGLVNVRC